MARNEHQHLIDKLPHKGNFRLIDSIACVDRSSVETRTQINPVRTELFGQRSEIESYVGIELMAQSAALPLIFRSEDREEHKGMIVQIRSFRSYSNPIDATIGLTTRCEIELMLNERVASVKGQVLNGETVVCEGVITLAIQVTPFNE